MSGDRGKPPGGKSPGGKPDWRDGLKGLRSRLPSAPPSPPAGAVAKKAARLAEPAPSPPSPPPDPAEEAALFERELESQGVVARPGAFADVPVDADAARLAQLPHAPGRAAGEPLPVEPAVAGPPGSRLKGDRSALSQRLDLHGYFLDDALAAVATFLEQHRELGSNEVLVVTGHAQRRAGDAVLRPGVEALLGKHPGVARVEPDGAGAFRVTLRPRRP